MWERAAGRPPHPADLHLPRRRRRRPLALRPRQHRGLPSASTAAARSPPTSTPTPTILDVTRACFDRYHEKFDEPYPFDSYDQAFVPEFDAGAMENPGLVTFRDEFVYRSAVTDTERRASAAPWSSPTKWPTWYGDLVTLRWWDDIWLNESFAE